MNAVSLYSFFQLDKLVHSGRFNEFYEIYELFTGERSATGFDKGVIIIFPYSA